MPQILSTRHRLLVIDDLVPFGATRPARQGIQEMRPLAPASVEQTEGRHGWWRSPRRLSAQRRRREKHRHSMPSHVYRSEDAVARGTTGRSAPSSTGCATTAAGRARGEGGAAHRHRGRQQPAGPADRAARRLTRRRKMGRRLESDGPVASMSTHQRRLDAVGSHWHRFAERIVTIAFRVRVTPLFVTSGDLPAGWHISATLAWVGLGVGLRFNARAVLGRLR